MNNIVLINLYFTIIVIVLFEIVLISTIIIYKMVIDKMLKWIDQIINSTLDRLESKKKEA